MAIIFGGRIIVQSDNSELAAAAAATQVVGHFIIIIIIAIFLSKDRIILMFLAMHLLSLQRFFIRPHRDSGRECVMIIRSVMSIMALKNHRCDYNKSELKLFS